jgi:hypothetical protein
MPRVIVLHAIWTRDSRLCVWGEDSSLPAVARRPPGRPPARPRPRPHPFACDPGVLREGLARLGLLSLSGVEGKVALMLPSSELGPQCSPQLLRVVDEHERPNRPSRLEAWEADALGFVSGSALDLLVAVPAPGSARDALTVPGGGVVVGDSLRFLAEMGKLALELVARGRLRPALVRHGEQWVARWPAHLQERIGREVLFLHGGTPKFARDEMVARFQSEQGPPVFVLSLKAGGTGLNLTAANHVIHYDRWWNPAVEDQATDRAFRIGQRKNVQVRKLTCVGTLEERIDQVIAEKKDLAERIVGSGEAWLTELDTAQLRELVALSGEAVVAA